MSCVFNSPGMMRLAAGLAAVSAGGFAFISIRHDPTPPFIRRLSLERSPLAPMKDEVATAAAESSPVVGRDAAETFVPSDDAWVALVRIRVATSLADALAWAESQTDSATREKLLVAVVRLWAETDPIAAARWALAREPAGSWTLVEAAVTGAAKRPVLAVEIGRMLLAADPELGAAHGTMLVGALTSAGEFDAAIRFARTAPAELREEWLAAAFHRWAAEKPEEAARAWAAIDDESQRRAVFQSLADGWAERDPAGLAAYVWAQPPSPDRAGGLAVAMSKWSERDPAAMAAWLNTVPRGAEFDAGAAVLVLRTDQANRGVDVALRWVESISALELRRASLQHVLTEWSQTDPDSARAYLDRIAWLTTDERALLRANVDRPVGG